MSFPSLPWKLILQGLFCLISIVLGTFWSQMIVIWVEKWMTNPKISLQKEIRKDGCCSRKSLIYKDLPPEKRAWMIQRTKKGQNWDYRSCLKLEMLLMVTNHKNCLSVPHYLFPRELTRISVWIKSSLLYLWVNPLLEISSTIWQPLMLL